MAFCFVLFFFHFQDYLFNFFSGFDVSTYASEVLLLAFVLLKEGLNGVMALTT